MIGLTQLMRPPEAACTLLSSTSRFLRPISIISEMKRQRVGCLGSGLDGFGSDSNLHAAIRAASIRCEETLRPDPLFIDPYAECLVFPDAVNCGMNEMHPTSSLKVYYILATKFIDDKILDEMNRLQDLRQIVLLTDGMDTRPYRLNLQRYTVIYDISPETVFRAAQKKLQACGAKVSKTCMMAHISLESDFQMLLPTKGFSGSKPSLWVLQGLPLTTLTEFEHILSTVSSLAKEGCHFIGEFPCRLLGTKFENKLATQRWMEKLFFSHGFRVSTVNCDEVARIVHGIIVDKSVNVLFVAKQLRLSDAQMETWRGHFERIDEEGNEEGFEEL